VGTGLFYSSVTTAAVTALDPLRSSLAGGVIYRCQVAGGAIGLGLNTAIVLAAATLAGGASPLTGRERDVLVASRDGATVAYIAARLFLSEGTVRNYLSAAIAKTGVRNRVEAYRAAEQRGWL